MDAHAAVASYAPAIRASVSQKNNNDFWPRGIPALSYPTAHHVLDSLRPVATGGGAASPASLHPTAALCLFLYLTHGVRRVGLPREERLTIASHILGHVAESRTGELVPDGPLRLRAWQQLAGADSLMDTTSRARAPEYIFSSFLLGARGWALGEAAFFFCHRLLTERHGPYQLADGTLVVCRHLANLDLCGLYPEVPRLGAAPSQVAIWLFLRPEAADTFTYDLFANPVFSIDPLADCLGVSVWASDADGEARRLDLAAVHALERELAALTALVLAVVSAASDRRLAGAMSATMRNVVERVLRLPVPQASPDVTPPLGYRVDGSGSELGRYYDWREEWP